jgi:hypothetical protein
MKTRVVVVLLSALFILSGAPPVSGMDAFITMQDGYFYDSATEQPWVPHGVAYQTWNRPLGVWQTFEQIDYDLDEMVKMGANSVRIDIVWQHAEEDGPGQFKWENYDYFINACEQRGLRIFALVGYQWPPNWFPDEWYTMHPPEWDGEGIYHPERWQSDIINYEHPGARAAYESWIQAVCGRYKDSKAIVGWIVGNEYGYLGLWSGLLDGYDPETEQAFRDWCEAKYGTIEVANAKWGSEFEDFDEVYFPDQYRAYGVEGAIWADAVAFREDSIADFTALSAAAAKSVNTNHLISYSTVGMQWGEEDWRYHAEHRGKITAAAAARGAPIDFFSVNNYPWSVLGHESQQGHWGVTYTKKVASVPVLYSETGFTSSETMWPGMDEFRQGPLIRNSLWESLQAGAIGTHVFSWQDRPWITDREKGFGVVYGNRGIKPAYWTTRDTYNLMKQVGISDLLGGSEDPTPNIAFLWTPANHSQYNRYECEMQQIAGALERLGFEPNFMDLNELAAGGYTNYEVVILPRNMRVEDEVPGSGKTVLTFLLENVIGAGVHVMATADLPGMQDFNGRPRAAFEDEVDALFGIDVSDIGGEEAPMRRRHYVTWYWNMLLVDFNENSPINGYHYWPQVWKYSDEVEVTDGTLWATMEPLRNKGFERNEDGDTNLTYWDGAWGETHVRSGWAWVYEGSNMVQMWGDSGMYNDFPVVPYGRYTHSAYLRNNPDDPLRGGAYASVSLEWMDEEGEVLSISESERLTAPNDDWVRYVVDDVAPANVWDARRVIRIFTNEPPNLLTNPGLSGSGAAPDSWIAWGDGNPAPDAGTYRTASPSWALWWASGLWQPVTTGFMPGDTVTFGGYLYTPDWDRLRNGDKYGVIHLEVYSNSTLLATYAATPPISSASPENEWIYVEGTQALPDGANKVHFVVRCDGSTGDGRFLADDLFLTCSPGGSVYVDNNQKAPAVVVKDHGTAKAAIFLYSAGDFKPDGNLTGKPDELPWEWRSDIFGAVVRDYFGVTAPIQVTGTNAYLCLADYRTLADGSTLWQVKNYMYDTNFPASGLDPIGGGAPHTFTISSPMFNGKTVRAFRQARIIEKESDGTIQLTLEPDGMEMLHVYTPVEGDMVLQIGDAPATIRPFGDKTFTVVIQYDTQDLGELTFHVVLRSADGEIILEAQQFVASGSGSQALDFFIPDPDLLDPDLLSSLDGGAWEFAVWAEDEEENPVTEPIVYETRLVWGIKPDEVPETLVKGEAVELNVEWQDLYEQLPWQNTPMTRADAFPDRVALYRSLKTEAQYPGHLDKVNHVADWLESMGYEPGNRQAVAFDNVMVALITDSTNGPAGPVQVFFDNMESGTNGWTASGLWHLDEQKAYSVSNGWAYNSGSHYNTGARNSGALMTPQIDLSGGVSASLRFRSWYETEDTGTTWDRKLVQVSTDGENWTTVAQISGQNKEWTVQAVDLKAYAGQQVYIRFFFDTMDAVLNQFQGWFLDDVSVTVLPAGDPVVLFEDDMEETTNWVGGGLWHLSETRAASGAESWAYNNSQTNYNTGARNNGALVSRWIDLSDVDTAQLSFKSWYRTEDAGTAWDRKLVQISADGINWTPLIQISGLPMQEWTTQDVDISAFAGQQIQLRFFFDTIDGIQNAFEGWYVDDVSITTFEGLELGTKVFCDEVEAGTNDWIAAGMWHVAGDRYSSETNAWAYNNGVNYNSGARNSGALISPWIDLTAALEAKLTFRSWYETEDSGTAWDRKLIHVSVDGINWIQAHQVSGAMREWTTQTVDLSAFAGERVRVRFFFDTIDGIMNNFAGWYVDDVCVQVVNSGVLFHDNFDDPEAPAWTRVAGSANWQVQENALHAWRIGNSDNMLIAGEAEWSDYDVSADILYTKQGPYFNDAEIYVRYQNRDNFVKVGIRNANGFWRLKYTVRADTNIVDQGWLYEFTKETRPVENVWYNLRVRCEGEQYTVFFDGEEIGSFTATNYLAGKVGIGSMADQLGIWEPVKGYFFVDDDEYSFWSPEGQAQTSGHPLNLDWGFLDAFYPTLILPGTYVMNDTEASNVVIWLNSGLRNLIATDGGIAMKDETGAAKPGRVEAIFGVAPALTSLADVERVTIGTSDHYITMDYAEGTELEAEGGAAAWTTLTTGRALGTADDGSTAIPALIANVNRDDPEVPKKVFTFNFGVDSGNQLTGEFSQLAQRVFEWARGQAYRVRIELKYDMFADNPDLDPTLMTWIEWVLGGTGAESLQLAIPETGIMTGTNLYWAMYIYPWDSDDPWLDHAGFYTSQNDGDGLYSSLSGIGLQILGGADKVFGGRPWDVWMGYDTLGEPMVLTYGLKEKGTLRDTDDFDDEDYDGWTETSHANIEWAATTASVLRADLVSDGGTSYLLRDGLDVADRNITIEYNVKFGYMTDSGGILYRGVPLFITRSGIGWGGEWLDTTPNYAGSWHAVRVNIRDGDPYPMVDVFVNGETRLLAQSLNSDDWINDTIGILSPTSYWYGTSSYTEWDNFRVEDEHYAFATETVTGVYMPTSDVPRFLPFVPNFDPDMLEFESTTLGGSYEWFAYFRGLNEHSENNVAVHFAPRLMVEDENFPVNMEAGDEVSVPVEWEELPQIPMLLTLKLVEIYSGIEYAVTNHLLSQAAGSAYFDIKVPTNAPTAETYLWASYVSETNAANPLDERLGLDDTFRFDTLGQPVGPETQVTVTNVAAPKDHVVIYSDEGFLAGCSLLTWDSYRGWGVGSAEAIFDALFTGVADIPEEDECFLTATDYSNTYAGWGLSHSTSVDLSDYSNLVFWVKTPANLNVGVESAGVNREVAISSYGWDSTDTWQEITIPKSAFSSVNWAQVKVPFKATLGTIGKTSHVDYIRWEKDE